MQEYVERLRSVVEHATTSLLEMPQDTTAARPRPHAWSPREVIGHLIDSASNNHQRFVRAQFQEDLVFPGYDQNAWVEAQQYAQTPWTTLVELWVALNLHIARVMAATPESIRLRPVLEHNLHVIAWETVPASQPTTLDYFMGDYVNHLEHHLRQILDREREGS